MRNKILLLFGLITLYSLFYVSGAVNGGNVTFLNSSRSLFNTSATYQQASSGNITEVIITGAGISLSWQGFYGNVTGVITLSNGNNNYIYNWSLASPQGEIYASTNNTINWGNIQCFNFTANGTYSPETAYGGTSEYGMNLSQLESYFSINESDFDGVNETFSSAIAHSPFFVGAHEFSSGECKSTRIYDGSGAAATGNFEEALLYEPVSTSVVYAAILENDQLGYDNAYHDFEMIVLEDGHNGNVQSTPYYFFVELE
jgi:hypothetical protein